MRFHLKAVGKTGVVSMTVDAQGDGEARRMVEDQGMRAKPSTWCCSARS